MVPILVLDALEYMSIQLAHYFLLLLRRDRLQRLLDDAAAVHLERQVEYVPTHLQVTSHDIHNYTTR